MLVSALPTGQDVALFLGRGDDPAIVALAGHHVGHMTAIVRAYTRSRGFDDAAAPPTVARDLAAVIVTATARLVSNPAGYREQSVAGVASVGFNEFRGFNLAELAVLNGWRRRAA